MASSRFYRPKIASPVRSEKDFIAAAENEEMNYFITDDDGERLMTRHIAEKTDRHQITYSFSSNPRDNIFITVNGKPRKYGKGGISFRLLYEYLCEHFNGGEYFIDEYFAKDFPTRPVYADFEELNDRIAEAVEEEKARLLESVPLKKDGTPNMWYRVSKEFMNFAFWKKPIVRRECERVASEIQDDIIRCLSTGQLTLRKQAVSEATMKIRATMPELDAKHVFFASGQLIRSLSVFVEIKG